MKCCRVFASFTIGAILAGCSTKAKHASETVAFRNGELVLHGVLYRPAGPGPFPVVFYNHGSAPGMLNNEAFEVIGPIFTAHGWIFFAPYRRGQGLSSDAGPYIGDEITAARSRGGTALAAETMVRLLRTDHLNDQLAALAWIKSQDFVRPAQIAAMGNSFGGIETVLGAERGGYCAAVDASGGAESWEQAPGLRELMLRAVEHSQSPILFIQAENDFNLAPSRMLYAAMKAANKPADIHIYPSFGSSDREGHSFAYRGGEIWRNDVLRFLDQNCTSKGKR